MWDRIIRPSFTHGHGHDHDHDCSVHKVLTKNLKATTILAIGLTAGLVPCTGAIAVFMTSTSLASKSNMLEGFLYVLSFSTGLGLAMTLVALIAISGKKLISSKIEKYIGTIEKSSGIITAVVIYSVGLVLLTTNIIHSSNHTGCHDHHCHIHSH